MAEATEEKIPKGVGELTHALLAGEVLDWHRFKNRRQVGSYTGLLLTATNVPLWAGNQLLMGPLFFSSALSTGLAATSLVARLLGPRNRKSRERFERSDDISYLVRD